MSRSIVTTQVISNKLKTKWFVRDLGVLVKQGTAPSQHIGQIRAQAAKDEYLQKLVVKSEG